MGLSSLLAAAALTLASPAPVGGGIGVFNDQLASGLTPAQTRFAATHYAGAQKLTRSQLRALKTIEPRFFVIQYRLALGLGYRARGDWIRIIDGDTWKREWPAAVRERWFAHRGGRRVFMKQWGWFLTNPDDASWRSYFTRGLRGEIARTGADGAFLDSASVPNYLGGANYVPRLPDLDLAFERTWTAKLNRWLPYVRAQIRRPVIANAGSWVTTRDRSDYSRIDGVMIEGFALGLSEFDWNLQQQRVSSLVRKGRIVIAQAYPEAEDVGARMFALGSYLLVRGPRTYLNLEISMEPEWFPEYEIELGAGKPVQREGGLHVRRFERGIVVVNPTDEGDAFHPAAQVACLTPVGGGPVGADGKPAGRLERATLREVFVGPRDAAVCLGP